MGEKWKTEPNSVNGVSGRKDFPFVLSQEKSVSDAAMREAERL